VILLGSKTAQNMNNYNQFKALVGSISEMFLKLTDYKVWQNCVSQIEIHFSNCFS